jgi:hypothetical protein
MLSAIGKIAEDISHGLLDSLFVPVALSTVGVYDARYLKVSPAFLSLIGCSWDDIAFSNLVGQGAALSNPARDRRLMLLDLEGGYPPERASLRHASGRLIETVVSAQRLWIDGTAVDLEIFQPICPLSWPRPPAPTITAPAAPAPRRSPHAPPDRRSRRVLSARD